MSRLCWLALAPAVLSMHVAEAAEQIPNDTAERLEVTAVPRWEMILKGEEAKEYQYLEVMVDFVGGLAAKAISYGKLRLTAQTDAGESLQLDETLSVEDFTGGFFYSVPRGIFADGPESGLRLYLNFLPPKRPFGEIAALEGSVTFRVPVQAEVVTVKKLPHDKPKPIESPILKKAGIEADVQLLKKMTYSQMLYESQKQYMKPEDRPVRGSPANAVTNPSLFPIRVTYRGPRTALGEMTLFDAAGNSVKLAGFTSCKGNRIVGFREPIPGDATLKVTWWIGEKEVTVPFRLAHLHLPTPILEPLPGRALPLSASLKRIDRQQAAFGKPIPLSIAVENTGTRPVWIDTSSLPWNSHPCVDSCLEVKTDSQFLTGVPAMWSSDPEWVKLDPGGRIHGDIDLSSYLSVRKGERKPEDVRVDIKMMVIASRSEPETAESWQRRSVEVGQLTVQLR